ncbi:MAG: CvpA family protein [Lachnospiraceae bacterium]|nr:CvpA family protein [Lachnospiraceae bacterium]MBR4993411.1 CvpA family protein [Lachnospiraceae bacterium]
MNFLLIFLALIGIWRVYDGFKNGVVKEIISLITLVILALATVLISKAIGAYFDKQIINMATAVLMFLILCIAHTALKFVFFSAKLISKLPVVSTFNKLLGAAFGVVETILFAWVIFTFVMYMDLGVLEEEIILYTQDNAILTYLYDRNYLAYEAGKIIPHIPFLKFLLEEKKI